MRTLSLLVIAACGAPSHPGVANRVPEGTPLPEPPIAIAWAPDAWDELGIAFDHIVGFDVEKHAWNPGGVVAQGLRRGDENVRWLIRTNVDESLDGFRRDHDRWKMKSATANVCGGRARVVIATRGEEHITCVMTETGNHPAWVPPRRAVAVEYRTRAGVPVVASFEIESPNVASWLAVEERFFAGLRCL